jgi:ATP-binding cassette subfamily B protein
VLARKCHYNAHYTQFNALAVSGLILAAIPATIAEIRFAGAAFRMRNWRSPDTRRLNYVEYVLATDSHAKEVKVYGLGATLMQR